jgi:bloom syndrome protein
MKMDNAKDFHALDQYFPDPQHILSCDDIPKTIVFTNSVNQTQVICRYLRERLGPQFHDYIGYLHANRTAKAKHKIMKRFRKGQIKILVATEAAGMVREALHFFSSVYIAN